MDRTPVDLYIFCIEPEVKSGGHASGVFSFYIHQVSYMSLDHSARAEIARLWLDAESVGRIAARFGISRQKICGRTRREKWPLRRRANASGDPDGLVRCDSATGAPVRGMSVVEAFGGIIGKTIAIYGLLRATQAIACAQIRHYQIVTAT
jgi:hypothetical protein